MMPRQEFRLVRGWKWPEADPADPWLNVEIFEQPVAESAISDHFNPPGQIRDPFSVPGGDPSIRENAAAMPE
jgi:hypothetical protein